MKNLLAFPEALVAVLKTQPNMKNYVPSKLKAGSRGGTWVGLFRNWAPTYAGTVLCKAVSETVLDLHINVTQVFPGKHDLEIRLTGPGSAELTYKNTGETITMQVKATPASIIYRHKTGFTIEQWRHDKEVRLWINNLPTGPKNLSLHLAFEL